MNFLKKPDYKSCFKFMSGSQVTNYNMTLLRKKEKSLSKSVFDMVNGIYKGSYLGLENQFFYNRINQ